MPPRRTRAAVKAEEPDTSTEQPATAERCASPQQDASAATTSTSPATSKRKGKARAARHQPLVTDAAPAAPASPPASTSADTAEASGSAAGAASAEEQRGKVSMEERQARMAELRARMAASSKANRRAILSEQTRTRQVAAELQPASASRKLEKAERLLAERDLLEAGEDVERHRNMHYSLEESERWDAKKEEAARRADQGQADFGDAAERAYRRQVRMLKPDVAKYRQTRDEAVKNGEMARATGAVVKTSGEDAQDEIFYGNHTPSDDALDRVVSHLNHEKQLIQNRSRRRDEDPDAQVNYINDSNRHFNKKLKRFFDKQTQEIRDNLERGTAL